MLEVSSCFVIAFMLVDLPLTWLYQAIHRYIFIAIFLSVDFFATFHRSVFIATFLATFRHYIHRHFIVTFHHYTLKNNFKSPQKPSLHCCNCFSWTLKSPNHSISHPSPGSPLQLLSVIFLVTLSYSQLLSATLNYFLSYSQLLSPSL